jgi:hypothetical protein
MQFDIVGGSYQNKYISMNAQRTINFYIHKQLMEGETDKFQHSLQPTPGLLNLVDTTRTYLRGIFVARTLTKERCFVAADNYLYELLSNDTVTSLGQMSNMTSDSSTVYFACNSENQVMISNTSASYIFDMDTDTLTQITDTDFPANPTSLAYLQGYFIVAAGGRVYYSDLLNGLSWNASSFFTPSAYADKTIAAVVWRDDIHCFGTESIEIYINDGSSPFSKQDRSTINVGLVSVDSLKVFHDGIIFLGRMNKGETKVYFYNGQTCTPLSPFSVDWGMNESAAVTSSDTPVLWNNLNTYFWNNWTVAYNNGIISFDDTYAELQYSKDGHIFYYLTVPYTSTTYVFDILTQEWTERQSLNPNNNEQDVFRGKHMTNFLNRNIFTDIYTGKLMRESFSIATELDSQITRTRISAINSKDKKYISIYDFELDMTLGVGLIATPATAANVKFYYSRNGGNTYSAVSNLSTGTSGQFTARPRLTKLGTARDWVFKLVVTDAANLAINSSFITGMVGTY